MVEEVYVSFEVAKLLKEKGFDWKCHSHYWCEGEKVEYTDLPIDFNNSSYYYSRPTKQMAMRWLREIHHIILVLKHSAFSGEDCTQWAYEIWTGDNFEDEIMSFKTYEEAVEASIKYCLDKLI